LGTGERVFLRALGLGSFNTMQPMGAIVSLVGIKDPSLFLTGEISPKRHINFFKKKIENEMILEVFNRQK
jgi:hypothetical protein